MAPVPPRSGVGRLIADRYLLVDRVGSGGMGHVWLAHDQRLDCDVALKEIRFPDSPGSGADHESRTARARAEARHAAVLRGHPHVVTVHDVLEHEGLPWIVMEYVAGAVDLRDRVARSGPLAPDACARIGVAVLDALTAGHEHGIMHRDVKPANILLAPDRSGNPEARVLLTDYGISVQPDSPETRWTQTSVLVGTAGYLAPERATGGPPTAAADLFSLGCTLYFGVEGHGPFDRDTDLAALTAVVLEEAPPPLRAGALRPVVEALLAKDPALRLSAEETASALAGILTPGPRPPTRLDPGSRPPWSGLVTFDGSFGVSGPAEDRSRALPGAHPSAEGAAAYGPAPDQGPTQDQGPAVPAGHSPAPGPYPPTGRGYGYPPTAGGHAYPAPAEEHGHPPTAEGYGPYAPVGHDRDSGTATPREGFHRPAPGQGHGPPRYGAPPAPVPGAPGRRRRKPPYALRAVAAALLAFALTAGVVVWYAEAHRVARLPYGDAVGLAEPLRRGDCVLGEPALSRTTDVPRLILDPDCHHGPDAQVMAVYRAPSFEAARRDGARRCAERTRDTAHKLAWNVRSMAVVPTREGFGTTGGTVACLLAGVHGPVFGPLGDLRENGMTFTDATQMQRGDCLGHVGGEARVGTHFELVACDGKEAGKVVEITHLGAHPLGTDPLEQANDQCALDAPPGRYDYDPSSYWSHGVRSVGVWARPYRLVVCFIEKGRRPSPGTR
ncbi:serine/threonine-protein kinase [Streptomyces triticiradicis]|uniref:serine/threonine-protein kinase n=1 Tax=Streptomyces triticiradicis TaxID=2651189 RepID=UPI001CEDEEF5|nr:serine/threonine-protein kinase [Streptomyces triticiradicis]